MIHNAQKQLFTGQSFDLVCPVCREKNKINKNMKLIEGSNTTCCVCISDKANIYFSSCGHVVVCYGCAKKMTGCAIPPEKELQLSQVPQNMINIRTEHGYKLRVLLNVIDKFCEEVNMTFLGSERGVKITATNERRTVLLLAKLNVDNFIDYFTTQNELTVRLDLIKLNKFMKNVNMDCIMSLLVKKDGEQEYPKIIFRSHDSINDMIIEHCQKTLAIDDNFHNFLMNDIWEAMVEINAIDLKIMCEEMMSHDYSECVEIICSSAGIKFQTERKIVEFFGNDEVEIVFKNNANADVKGKYILHYIYKIACCSDSCDNVKLYLKNSHPLIVHFVCGSLVNMLAYFSPAE